MALGDVTGSAPDVFGAFIGVSEAMRAGKGFVFGTCVIEIDRADRPDQPAAPAASASSPRDAKASQRASAASKPADRTPKVRQGPIFFQITTGSVGEGGPRNAAQLGLRQVDFAERVVAVVELRSLDPKYDELFDSVGLEMVPTQSEAGSALLALKGFANPGGAGYAHFSAGVHVRVGADGRLTTQVAFVSQAPPPSGGAGIFGKTVFVDDLGAYVRVHMESRPLFNR